MISPIWEIGDLTVRLSNPSDAGYLCERLLPWDMVECFALGHDPMSILMMPFVTNAGLFTRTLEWKGCPFAMCGVSPLDSKRALPWYLTSGTPKKARLILPHVARVMVREALKHFERLENVIPAGHLEAKEFVRLLGFDISPEITHFRSVPFQWFSKERIERPER